MAAVTRQPFAPLDGARLQSLTSLKNRQNAISANASSGKRKAELLDTDDFENVDPLLFAKRSKGASSATPPKDILKPSSNFILAAKTNTPVTEPRSLLASPTKASSTPRRALQPRSPIAKPNAKVHKSSPIAAPAGRSPTQSKRSGILSNRRRTAGPYTRIDPPSFNTDSSAPFSLDAALKGTITSYGSRAISTKKPVISSLLQPEAKASWFFDIHEDTPEQEMTNLLQHGTCVLDISDEESELKARRDADGRDKENIPPVDDVSQTSTRMVARQNPDDMVVEKERVALGEMNATDFYPKGCDEASVILIPEDDEPQQEEATPIVNNAGVAPEPENEEPEPEIPDDIDSLMSKSSGSSSKAAVLRPIEGTGESFELWESGSAKDDAETTTESS